MSTGGGPLQCSLRRPRPHSAVTPPPSLLATQPRGPSSDGRGGCADCGAEPRRHRGGGGGWSAARPDAHRYSPRVCAGQQRLGGCWRRGHCPSSYRGDAPRRRSPGPGRRSGRSGGAKVPPRRLVDRGWGAFSTRPRLPSASPPPPHSASRARTRSSWRHRRSRTGSWRIRCAPCVPSEPSPSTTSTGCALRRRGGSRAPLL